MVKPKKPFSRSILRFVESNARAFFLADYLPHLPYLRYSEYHQWDEIQSNLVFKRAISKAEKMINERLNTYDRDRILKGAIERFGRESIIMAVVHNQEEPPVYSKYNEIILKYSNMREEDLTQASKASMAYFGLHLYLSDMDAKLNTQPRSTVLYRGCTAQLELTTGQMISLLTFTSTCAVRSYVKVALLDKVAIDSSAKRPTLFKFVGPVIGFKMQFPICCIEEHEVLLFPYQTFMVEQITEMALFTEVTLRLQTEDALAYYQKINRFFPALQPATASPKSHHPEVYFLTQSSINGHLEELLLKQTDLQRADYVPVTFESLKNSSHHLPQYHVIQKMIADESVVLVPNLSTLKEAARTNGATVYVKDETKLALALQSPEQFTIFFPLSTDQLTALIALCCEHDTEGQEATSYIFAENGSAAENEAQVKELFPVEYHPAMKVRHIANRLILLVDSDGFDRRYENDGGTRRGYHFVRQITETDVNLFEMKIYPVKLLADGALRDWQKNIRQNLFVYSGISKAEKLLEERLQKDSTGQLRATIERLGRESAIAAIACSFYEPPLYKVLKKDLVNTTERYYVHDHGYRASFTLYSYLSDLEWTAPPLPRETTLYRACAFNGPELHLAQVVSISDFTWTISQNITSRPIYPTMFIFTGAVSGLDMTTIKDYEPMDFKQVLLFPFQTFDVVNIKQNGVQREVTLRSLTSFAFNWFSIIDQFFPATESEKNILYRMYTPITKTNVELVLLKQSYIKQAGYVRPTTAQLATTGGLPKFNVVQRDVLDEAGRNRSYKTIILNLAYLKEKQAIDEMALVKYELETEDVTIFPLSRRQLKTTIKRCQKHDPEGSATSYIFTTFGSKEENENLVKGLFPAEFQQEVVVLWVNEDMDF